MAPLRHEFAWGATSWDHLAAGIVAGHIIECGAQCSGGNCLYDWRSIPDLANVGYPLVEVNPDGTFVVTKHPNTGGRVSVQTITEQLVYENGRSALLHHSRCHRGLHIDKARADGENRVLVSGIKGKPPTDKLKVSVAYRAGFKAVGTLVYAWPDALEKAQLADRILRERLDRLGLRFERILSGVRRRKRHARTPGGRSVHRARGATTIRGSWIRSCGRGTIHAGDCTARFEWTAECHGIRGWTAKGRGDRGVLASSDRQVGCEDQSGSHPMKVRLVDIAHARSGDKGDTANVGVIALEPRWYPVLDEFVTRSRVADHFRGMINGDVDRFELPNLNALNFLLHGALDGGGTLSLKTDAQGKVFSTALLRMVIDVPDAEATRLQLPAAK